MSIFSFRSAGITGFVFICMLLMVFFINDSYRKEILLRTHPDSLDQSQELPIDPGCVESENWVDIHDPGSAFNGFTLLFYRQRIPMIIDMNGSILHAWPSVRGWGRMRLTRGGNLILIGTDNLIHEYDWTGNHLWSFDIDREKDFPHHDFRVRKNGNILCIYRDTGDGTDYVVEIHRDKGIVWEWMSHDHIRRYFGSLVKTGLDVTHFNSIRELPENHFHADGDDRFRPGNILISARELNAIFIVDRETGEIVWDYRSGLDRQHEAIMIGEGHDNEGHVLLFNNGTDNLYRYRRSQVLEIDPLEKRIVWAYETPQFFSSIQGMQQHLPNGNVMISSTRGGRLFEIDRNGRIVWQVIPPFDPMRPERYPFDYCPYFSEFGGTECRTVARSRSEPYIDKDLYRFEINGRATRKMFDGQKRQVLKTEALEPPCRLLTIPEDAEMRFGFGIDEETARGMDEQGVRLTVAVDVEMVGGGRIERLFEYVVDNAAQSFWYEHEISLREYGYATIRLRLIEESEAPSQAEHDRRVLSWMNPEIESLEHKERGRMETMPLVSDMDSVLVIQRLRALGYMD